MKTSSPSRKTIARKPSHFGSYSQPSPVGQAVRRLGEHRLERRVEGQLHDPSVGRRLPAEPASRPASGRCRGRAGGPVGTSEDHAMQQPRLRGVGDPPLRAGPARLVASSAGGRLRRRRRRGVGAGGGPAAVAAPRAAAPATPPVSRPPRRHRRDPGGRAEPTQGQRSATPAAFQRRTRRSSGPARSS